LATTRTNASSAVARGSVTPSTVSSARGWRRIETGVRRSSIWVHRGRICSTRRRISGTNIEDGWPFHFEGSPKTNKTYDGVPHNLMSQETFCTSWPSYGFKTGSRERLRNPNRRATDRNAEECHHYNLEGSTKRENGNSDAGHVEECWAVTGTMDRRKAISVIHRLSSLSGHGRLRRTLVMDDFSGPSQSNEVGLGVCDMRQIWCGW